MAKIQRNVPCPCGSGKKYKHCCISKVSSSVKSEKKESQEDSMTSTKELTENEAAPQDADNSVDHNQSQTNDTKPSEESIDESPILSEDQMHKILTLSFEKNSDIVSLNSNISDKDMQQIPALNQAWYFLTKLKELGPIKATQKGNLSKQFVLDLHEGLFKDYVEDGSKVNKEMDCLPIHNTRVFLLEAELIQLDKSKYSLTEKAQQFTEQSNFTALYKELFLAKAEKSNWGTHDDYTELATIQQSLIFNLYLLSKMAGDWIKGEEIGKIYLKAYPDLKNEVTSDLLSQEKQIYNCFAVRFLKNFAVEMGLLESKFEEGLDEALIENMSFKTTAFFKQSLQWQI